MRHVGSEASRNCETRCGAHHHPHFASHTTEPRYQPVFTSAVHCGNSTWLRIAVVANRGGFRARQNATPDIKVSYFRGLSSDSVETITAVVTVPGGEIPNPAWTSGQGDLTRDQDPNGQCPLDTRDKIDSPSQVKNPGIQPQDLRCSALQGSPLGESSHGFSAQNTLGADLGLSMVCWDEIRQRLESLAIADHPKDEPGTVGNICIKQEPQSDPVSHGAGEGEPDDQQYWQLDPKTDRFRHWDMEDEQWVYYPEEFD
ncbi:hypothetical protein B0T10DRAFT_471482 [Thelonectria olida]|uniref:Uncharacterized protein n=1 Tax=Thelonectria olida TaxID=1576542 RepID=A0A9P8WK04_9HYPO|nr:hypothetical protein B0T10DRAFT_471482 [Thelonectria olida]